MSATLEEVMLAIKATAEEIDGLTGYSVEPPSPHYPALWPFVRDAAYHSTFDGAMTWHITLSVAVEQANAAFAQNNIYPYLAPTGARSIRQTFEADPSLGLTGVSCLVRGVTTVGRVTIAGKEPLVCQFDLEVITS